MTTAKKSIFHLNVYRHFILVYVCWLQSCFEWRKVSLLSHLYILSRSRLRAISTLLQIWICFFFTSSCKYSAVLYLPLSVSISAVHWPSGTFHGDATSECLDYCSERRAGTLTLCRTRVKIRHEAGMASSVRAFVGEAYGVKRKTDLGFSAEMTVAHVLAHVAVTAAWPWHKGKML